MKTFIYYYKSCGDSYDDVAIVHAKSKNAAKKILSKYYTDLTHATIKEIITEGENLPEIEIISDY